MPWYIYNNRGVLQQPGPPDTIPVGLVSFMQSVESPALTPPTGWLMCDGATHATASYPQLAAILAYPAAPGVNFTVPDLDEFFVIGQSGSYPLGSTGGDDLHGHAVNAHSHSNTHTHGLTTAHRHAATHYHDDSGASHTHGAGSYALNDETGSTRWSQITGGGSTDTPKGPGASSPHGHDVSGSSGQAVDDVNTGDTTPVVAGSTTIYSGYGGTGTSGSAGTSLGSATPPLADVGTKLPPYLNTYCIIKAVDLTGQYI